MKSIFSIAVVLVLGTVLYTNSQTVERKTLTIDGAKKAIAAAIAYAKKNNAPGGVIAVVDEGGNLMALERLDGYLFLEAFLCVNLSVFCVSAVRVIFSRRSPRRRRAR